jgi:hypothetical protein
LCWWLDLIQAIHFAVPSEGLHLQCAWENECCACNFNTGKLKKKIMMLEIKNTSLKVFVTKNKNENCIHYNDSIFGFCIAK